MNESEKASQQPDASLAPTLSLSQADASSRGDGGSAPAPRDDREKVFAIVRAMIECRRDETKLFAGRFRLMEQLGEGGFGRVYRAVDQEEGSKTLGQEMAVKLLAMPLDESSQRGILFSQIPRKWFLDRRQRIVNWINEIQRHQSVGKPGIDGVVPVIDASVPGSTDLDAILAHVLEQPIWLAMPVYPQTLANYFAENAVDGKLPVDDAGRIMLSVAQAIQRMHNFKRPEEQDQEIIHRDLKPANILMDVRGNPFVADFGLATGLYDQPLTGNPISGTLPFMAPELHKGHAASQRTDVWAWGVIFYWLLSGRLPFVAGTVTELQEAILNHEPDDLSHVEDVPSYLAKIVMRCLTKNRDGKDGRYGSLRLVLEAIDKAEWGEHAPPIVNPPMRSSTVSVSDVSIGDLHYTRRWLPYQRYGETWTRLNDFVNDTRRFLWWGVIGEGGTGKSRLALELAEHCQAEGWRAGFVVGGGATEWLTEDSRNWRPVRNTLLIVDYASNKGNTLLAAIGCCSTNAKCAGGPIFRSRFPNRRFAPSNGPWRSSP